MTTLRKTGRAALAAGMAMTGLLGALDVSAHAKLESTTPKADATVSSPQLIQARFSEGIEAKLSSLKLLGPDGKEVSTMSMNDAKDASTLAIMPNMTLPAGIYKVSWNVVSDDGHKMAGTFSFTVK